ncbi:hypothetical protein TNCV_1731551 [Trichonephila clavipes]|nr:hypothetical protein TNCV_1731551 [Trichonephila clavipes]
MKVSEVHLRERSLSDTRVIGNELSNSEPRAGHGRRVVKVSDRGWPCHEFEPSTTKDPSCRGTINENSNRMIANLHAHGPLNPIEHWPPFACPTAVFSTILCMVDNTSAGLSIFRGMDAKGLQASFVLADPKKF